MFFAWTGHREISLATMSETGEMGNDLKRQKTEPADGLGFQKPQVPEGMSKNAWKKLQKQKKWDEEKAEYRLKRKEKKKAARARKAERKSQGLSDDDNYHQQAKKAIPEKQKPSGIKVIMDCEFDELMSEKEIVSMSNQITRCYSAKRHSDYDVDLVVSSFNKRLKQRFDKSVLDYPRWKNITFVENDKLTDLLPKDAEELSKCVYLTADTDTELDELEQGHTYIIGGIVDKNRHKKLCLNKAKELGLKVGRLPIGKYIQMNGRQVLATSHVYEIMCMWFEQGNDWQKAFNAVLPPRKIKGEAETKDETETKDGEEPKDEEETADDGKENGNEHESEDKENRDEENNVEGE